MHEGYFHKSVCKTLSKEDYENESFKLQMRHDSNLQTKNGRGFSYSL